MTSLSVQPIEKGLFDSWDAMIARSPSGTVFHRSAWVTAIGGLSGRTPVIYGCFDRNDELTGGTVTYQYRRRGVRLASSETVMSPFGGVTIAPKPGMTERAAGAHARRISCAISDALEREPLDLIILEQSACMRDIRPFLWKGWQSSVGYTFVLPLSAINPTAEARRYIRRAGQEGIVVEQVADIDRYWLLFEHMFRRQGLAPPLDMEQMRSVFAVIIGQNMGEMWAAITPSGEWAVAEILLRDENCYYSWSAASNHDLLATGANFLLNHTLFEHERASGYLRSCLFSANKPKLSQVMSQFNPELHPHYRVTRRQGRLGFLNHLPMRLP